VNLELSESSTFSPYPGLANRYLPRVAKKIKAVVQEQRGMAMLIGKSKRAFMTQRFN
jgi:hypothetical protein